MLNVAFPMQHKDGRLPHAVLRFVTWYRSLIKCRYSPIITFSFRTAWHWSSGLVEANLGKLIWWDLNNTCCLRHLITTDSALSIIKHRSRSVSSFHTGTSTKFCSNIKVIHQQTKYTDQHFPIISPHWNSPLYGRCIIQKYRRGTKSRSCRVLFPSFHSIVSFL